MRGGAPCRERGANVEGTQKESNKVQFLYFASLCCVQLNKPWFQRE